MCGVFVCTGVSCDSTSHFLEGLSSLDAACPITPHALCWVVNRTLNVCGEIISGFLEFLVTLVFVPECQCHCSVCFDQQFPEHCLPQSPVRQVSEGVLEKRSGDLNAG